jgi:DedD protein
MGLFSFFSKNKQGRTAEDSGRFYSKDDDAAIGERARAKRASNAGGAARRAGNDPMLPEKKRARRRLVGAVALALAAAVGLPMLLDSEPKPLAGDIAIQIPPKDKAAPLPVPGESGVAASGAAASAPRDKVAAAEDSVDKDEEIIDAPGVATPGVATPGVATPVAPKVAERKPEVVKPKPEPKPEAKPEAAKPERKEAKAEHKDSKAEARLAERAERERIEKAAHERAEKDRAERLERQRAEEKARRAAEDKPAKPVQKDADARALAILEGKSAEREKAVDKDKLADSGAAKVTLQVAAMSSQEKAAEVQARLRGAGISSHTEKFGELIRVKVGPLSKEEAERVRAKLNKLGL